MPDIKIRSELLASNEIQKILFQLLIGSFGANKSYWSGTKEASSLDFMNLVNDLGIVSRAEDNNEEVDDAVKQRIFTALIKLHNTSNLPKESIIAEYVAIFCVIETNNHAVQNERLRLEYTIHQRPAGDCFPTTQRLLKDLLALYVDSTDKKIKDNIRYMIQQSSAKNTYIKDISDTLIGILIRKKLITAEEWEEKPILNSMPKKTETVSEPKSSEEALLQKVAQIKEKLQVMKPVDDPKEKFILEHKRLFAEDKKGVFAWFRTTKLTDYNDWSLKDILQHAKDHNNRSRQACVKLGWMNSDGTLKAEDSVPEDVKNAYHSDDQTPTLR
jgi:hypothetical protein